MSNSDNNMQALQSQNKTKSTKSHKLHEKIITVSELLSETELSIPDYQRPYKWNQQNIANLFNDIKTQSDKSAYRLGTIVLHRPKDDEDNLKNILNIVDGQQRTLTLMLTVMAIIKYYNLDDSTQPESEQTIREVLGNLTQSVPKLAERQNFASDISVYNLHTNFQEILRIISRGELNIEHIDFLLHKCEVVIFVLENESEAFQFFDSQNSRGKDLYPHDLLKAFHLREFKTGDEALRIKTVNYWENLDDDRLDKLFSNHLYRIRRWSRGQSAQTFTKDDVVEFKGITLESKTLPPYTRRLAITHHYIDDYNNSVHCKIAGSPTAYPFSIDQTIINGRRFFEMVAHYDALITKYKAINNGQASSSEHIVTLFDHALNKRASKIINTLDSYNNYQRRRKGDKLTRNVFDNALIYYIDKFGAEELPQAVELLFAWAYIIRLTSYSVGLTTIDKHATKSTGMFMRINEAILPKNVVITSIPSLKIIELATNQKPESGSDIYMLFDSLNYIDTSGA
ncbi:DUF262 domain-containing protein [Psychrobacter sp. FBL11]|uniref:DUF262 domain-containing protein n=1 Tax=Psychrobacter saeujeotis TaxID=3143436 RepID=A0ABU9X760_9GAMM|nr:DUF262 domain-containing protein [uncultured Psychrobacter sp.]